MSEWVCGCPVVGGGADGRVWCGDVVAYVCDLRWQRWVEEQMDAAMGTTPASPKRLPVFVYVYVYVYVYVCASVCVCVCV